MQYIYFVLVKGGDNTSVKYVCRHQFSYIFCFLFDPLEWVNIEQLKIRGAAYGRIKKPIRKKN